MRLFGGKEQGANLATGSDAAIPRSAARKSDSGGLYHRTFESLGDPNFRYFFFGFLLLMGGVNMQMVARSVLAFELTDSALAVGYVGAGFAPPILLFSLWGGAIADRVDRKRLIQIGQIGMTIIAVLVGLSIVTDTVTIWHLIAASLAQGTYVTDHYTGHPWVLVRLATVRPEQLAEVIEQAWRRSAPRSLIAQFDAGE